MSAAKKTQNSTIVMKEKYVQNAKWEYIHIAHELTPQEVLDAVIKKQVQHVVHDANSDYEKEVNVSALMQVDPDEFFKDPVMSIIDPDGAGRKNGLARTAVNMEFCRSGQKYELLRQIEQALLESKTSASLLSDIMVIADELITNAIYNAPFVDAANSVAGASRASAQVQMPEGKSARLLMGISEEKLVICVQDPFGALNVERLLERIKHCYDTSVADSINMSGDGGAGIGSFMIYNSSSSYYLAVDEGKNTTVCAALPLKMSGRARQALPKNIHIIVRKKE